MVVGLHASCKHGCPLPRLTCLFPPSMFLFVNSGQVHSFVVGVCDASKDESSAKAHLRDFLIELKEFSGEDNAELYMDDLAAAARQAEEEELVRRRAVPGLLRPVDIDDDVSEL